MEGDLVGECFSDDISKLAIVESGDGDSLWGRWRENWIKTRTSRQKAYSSDISLVSLFLSDNVLDTTLSFYNSSSSVTTTSINSR